jgi:hypothetical protein
MHVTQRTPDTLVIEEGAGTKTIVGSFCVVAGAVGILIGWTKGETGFLIIPPSFCFTG